MRKKAGRDDAMMRMKMWTLVLGFSLIALLTGCAQEVSLADERAAFALKAADEIKIGAAWPFASNNDLAWEGMRLAVDKINAGGGVNGKTLALVKQDDDASVTRGMEIAQAFAENPEISAVIGHRNSHVSVPVASIYERAGLLMMSPASSAPELSEKGYRYVFRNIASDDKVAQELVSYAREQGHRKMVILYVDNAYGRGLADAFEDHARDQGVEIVDRLSYYNDLDHLQRLRTKWTNLGYDGIFIAKSNPEGAKTIADLRRAEIDVPLFGGNAMDSEDLLEEAGGYSEGTVVGSFFNPHDQREKVQRFIEAFEEAYGEQPTQYAAQAYDAVYLLAEAMERAESAVASDMAQALRSLEGFEGVVGIHAFAENGDDVGELVVKKKVADGQFEYIGN